MFLSRFLYVQATPRSSTSGAFDVPHTRTEFGKRAFSVTGHAAWNIYLHRLDILRTFGQLKRAVKAHLYGVAYNV